MTLPSIPKSKIKPNHTPTQKKMKSKLIELVHSLSLLNVINLIGKRQLCIKATKSASKLSGKCNIWGIIFESKEDKAFCKKNWNDEDHMGWISQVPIEHFGCIPLVKGCYSFQSNL